MRHLSFSITDNAEDELVNLWRRGMEELFLPQLVKNYTPARKFHNTIFNDILYREEQLDEAQQILVDPYAQIKNL
uniref:DHC_N2 domain-containing protein n=1 Tax=Strongyloides papillosus TaxID=174720 RepID=A0A0N5BUN8_STREA